MTTLELDILTKSELSGKLFVAALEQLRVTNERTYAKAKSDHKRSRRDEDVATQPMRKRRSGVLEDNTVQARSTVSEVPVVGWRISTIKKMLKNRWRSLEKKYGMFTII